MPLRKSRKRSKKSKCKKYLAKKVSINMIEYSKGLYVSPSQAIAVAYSQVRKKHPSCKRILKKSKRRSKMRRSMRRKM